MKPSSLLLICLVLVPMLGCSSVIQSTSPQVTLNQSNLNDKIIYTLPKGMIRIAYSQEKGQPAFVIETVFVPDADHYCALEIRPNSGYDDEVQVSVDTNGLLKAINVSTTSQVGAILMELVETAKQVSKFAAVRTAKEINFDILIDPDELPQDSPALAGLAKQFQKIDKVKVDLEGAKGEVATAEQNLLNAAPKDKRQRQAALDKATQAEKNKAQELKEAQTYLTEKMKNANISADDLIKYNNIIDRYQKYGLRYIAFNWEKINIVNNQTQITTETESEKSDTSKRSVYYRPLLPGDLKVMFDDNLYEKKVYLPNRAPIIAWDITRPAFTKKVTKLTFANGVLTEVYLNQPSEMLAGLKIPSEIIKSVAGMPLELLQFRVNYADAYNQLLQAQIQQIQNSQQLMQLQQQGK